METALVLPLVIYTVPFFVGMSLLCLRGSEIKNCSELVTFRCFCFKSRAEESIPLFDYGRTLLPCLSAHRDCPLSFYWFNPFFHDVLVFGLKLEEDALYTSGISEYFLTAILPGRTGWLISYFLDPL